MIDELTVENINFLRIYKELLKDIIVYFNYKKSLKQDKEITNL